jgi:hypothetical protein
MMLSDATGWSCEVCSSLIEDGRGLFQCTAPYFHPKTFVHFRQNSRDSGPNRIHCALYCARPGQRTRTAANQHLTRLGG